MNDKAASRALIFENYVRGKSRYGDGRTPPPPITLEPERAHEDASIAGGILSTIGHTPLVRLRRALRDCPFDFFAKLEGFNPGGSAKDRPALQILQDAMCTGAIKPWTAVIESSSGN